MSVYFIDTSSLAKRYVQEIGSTWFRKIIKLEQGHTFIISELTLVETISMIEANRRRGIFPTSVADYLRVRFLIHARNQYVVVPIDSKIIKSARKLLIKHRAVSLRGPDAIQLATALQIRVTMPIPIVFMASDNKLLKAAAAEEELVTENPSLYS